MSAMFDSAGTSIFPPFEIKSFLLGLLNSKIMLYLVQILNPTLAIYPNNIANIPFKVGSKEYVDKIVGENIKLSKVDWDSFEVSWDFKKHPLLRNVSTISEAFARWQAECDDRFNQLKANEEELNRIFIDIYGLQDELTPEVEDKDVTVRKADLQRDVKSLLSYAVGCMFGRYSLDVEGLAYAGGLFSDQWVVVGGQDYKREVVEKYVSEELQRTLGMAEINADCGGNISTGETAAEGRIVCFVGSDAPSGGIDSFQYCRGTSEKLYEGICELSFDSKGISSRIGNTVYDLCSPEILAAIANGTGDELVKRGWKDAERIDWKAIHCTLTTDHYCPDRDNIIPITDEEYLDDDIVSRLCAWLKAVYGADTLEENLDYIANALGNKGSTSREIIRNYFLNDFFKDHCQTYSVTGSGKRPIYWLFDSGKQNGFKALVYLHRYTPDTIGNLRIDYLHKMQRVYESEINRMQDMMDHSGNAREVAAAGKRKDKLAKQLKECREYDEKISHLALSRIELDLDDGVKVNYRKLQTAQDGKFYEVLADSKNIMAKQREKV